MLRPSNHGESWDRTVSLIRDPAVDRVVAEHSNDRLNTRRPSPRNPSVFRDFRQTYVNVGSINKTSTPTARYVGSARRSRVRSGNSAHFAAHATRAS